MDFNGRLWDSTRLFSSNEHSYCALEKPVEKEQFYTTLCSEPVPKYSHYRFDSRSSVFEAPTDESIYIDVVDDLKPAAYSCRLDSSVVGSLLSVKLDGPSPHIPLERFSIVKKLPQVFSHGNLQYRSIWVAPVRSAIRRMERTLLKVYWANKLQTGSKEEIATMRILNLRKICRKIRDMFAGLNWMMEMCVIVHHNLLELLPDMLLSLYVDSCSELWKQGKINKLIGQLNATMKERNLLKRFPYQRFLQRLIPSGSNPPAEDTSQSNVSLPFICRANFSKTRESQLPPNAPLWMHKLCSNRLSSISAFETFSVCPYPSAGPSASLSTLICNSSFNAYRTAASTSLLGPSQAGVGAHVLPVFACLTFPAARTSRRVVRFIRHLSDMGRVSLETPEEQACDTLRLRLRLFTRRVMSLLEEQRSGPVFVVGFGLGSVLTLISLLHLAANPTQLSLNSADGVTRQLGHAGAENSALPYLAGFICLGMPLLGIKGDRGLPLDPLLGLDAKFCGLFVVGKLSRLGNEDHMLLFRDKILAFQRAKMKSQTEANCNATTDPTDCGQNNAVGLRVLGVGGADHLLRLRPSVLGRWRITQESVDCSICFSIAQFVSDCKNSALIRKLQSSRQADGQNAPVGTPALVSGGVSVPTPSMRSSVPTDRMKYTVPIDTFGGLGDSQSPSMMQTASPPQRNRGSVQKWPTGRIPEASPFSPPGGRTSTSRASRVLNQPLTTIQYTTPKRSGTNRIHHTTPSYLSLTQSQPHRTTPRILQSASSAGHSQRQMSRPGTASASNVQHMGKDADPAESVEEYFLATGRIAGYRPILPSSHPMASSMQRSSPAGQQARSGSRRKLNHSLSVDPSLQPPAKQRQTVKPPIHVELDD